MSDAPQGRPTDVGLRFDPPCLALPSGLTEGGPPSIRLSEVHRLDDGTVLLFWVGEGDVEAVTEAMSEWPDTDSVDRLGAGERRELVRVEVDRTSKFGRVYETMMEADVMLTELVGREGGWSAVVTAPSKAALDGLYSAWGAVGFSPDVQFVRPSRCPDDGQSALSEQQRQALAAAVQSGYFEVPRGSTLSDIAATFGISDQAVSERIRRGTKRLVENEVGVAEEGGDEDEGDEAVGGGSG